MISSIGSQPKAYMQNVSQKDKKEVQTSQQTHSNTDRLSLLKEQIQSGKYEVNISKTAKAIAEEIL